MIKELARYIAASLNTGLSETTWRPGSKVFAGYMPQDSPDEAVAVLESGGTESYEVPNLMELQLQILTRADTYERASDIAFAAHRAIHGKSNAGRKLALIDNPGHYLRIESAVATDIPAPIGKDGKGRYEFSANYILRTEEE